MAMADAEHVGLLQSKASMAKALRVFAKRENYPVMVHCIHGKDRTGLIIMLLLLICDVPSKVTSREIH